MGKKPTINSKNGISLLANDRRAVALDEGNKPLGGKVHQPRKEQGQDQHREDDAPIPQLVTHLPASDHQRPAQPLAGCFKHSPPDYSSLVR